MFNSFFRSQRGSAIIQGMFLAAAVAGMAYVGTKLNTNQKLSQKGVESKGRTEQLHEMVYGILQNNSHCSQTLNLNGATADLAVTTPIPLSGIATQGTLTIDQSAFRMMPTGSNDPSFVYINNSVFIKSMTLTYPADFSNPAVMAITYGRLDDKGGSRTGKGYGAKDVLKTIQLRIQRNIATGAFESCYAVTLGQNQDMIKDFCEDLGSDGDKSTPSLFYWDAEFQSCRLREMNCPSGQIFSGFDGDGIKQCHALQDWMDLNSLLDNSSPVDIANKNVRFEIVGQKVRISASGAGTCTPAVYSYSAWSACSSGTETRTVASCVGTCDGSCGTPVLSQPCASKLCSYIAWQPAPGDPACWPGNTELNEVPCSTDSDCPVRPPTMLPCVNQPIAFLQCGQPTAGPPCVPAVSCDVIASSVCESVYAGADSCGNACGDGTKGCLPNSTWCSSSHPGFNGGYPDCSGCMEAPLNDCNCPGIPSHWATCGWTTDCGPCGGTSY